jgi:hypothetical protein
MFGMKVGGEEVEFVMITDLATLRRMARPLQGPKPVSMTGVAWVATMIPTLGTNLTLPSGMT